MICFGESTTAGGEYSYPAQLEKILNAHNVGIRFSVINKGMTRTNTSILLSLLEYNLDKYKPDMVITMMGINDDGAHMPYEDITHSKAILFLRSLRTYKLARLSWMHMVAKAKEIGLYKLKTGGEINKLQAVSPRVDLYDFHTEPENFIWDEEMRKKAIEINPKNDVAYRELGSLYKDEGNYDQAREMFKKAVVLNPQNDKAYFELGDLYIDNGNYIQAEELLNNAIESYHEAPTIYGALVLLYQEMKKNKIAQKYFQKATMMFGYYKPVTIANYHKLKKILDKRNIKLVCVQYPIGSVKPLKKIFKGQESVIFVDNEKIFKDVLKKTSYKEYFRDIFGGDFGHCTPEGYRLLAQNIANVILEEYFNRTK